MLRSRRDILSILETVWRRYGDLTRLPAPLSVPKHLVVHPNQVRHVLIDRNENYCKPPLYRKMEDVFGPTIFTVEGDDWHLRRRLAQPAFRRDQIVKIGPIVAERTASMLERWAEAADAERAVDIPLEMTRLALAIAAGVFFDAYPESDVDAIARGIPTAQRHLTRRMKGYPDVPDWLPVPSHQRYRSFQQLLQALGSRLIADRRARSESHQDLLSILLGTGEAAAGESLTEDQLRSEVLAYLLAGHEVGHSMTWAWYLLARHPRVEQRLQVELAEVLGGRVPTVEDLPHLKYTDMVVQETLRLYPPLWGFTRSAIRDDEIGGYFIPAGSTLYISPYLTHRHPEFWKDPERFDPERFDPSRWVDRPPLAYFPFGGGPRACIGARFATTEARLVLATVAQRFRLRLHSDRPVAPNAMVMLVPRGALPMVPERVPKSEPLRSADKATPGCFGGN